VLPLATVPEGCVPLANSPPRSTLYAQEDPLRGVLALGREGEDRDGSIFLIDLEEPVTGPDGRTQIKPKSKKFSAASLLGGKFTQNWFFRRLVPNTVCASFER
jgi:hypothetical protein